AIWIGWRRWHPPDDPPPGPRQERVIRYTSAGATLRGRLRTTSSAPPASDLRHRATPPAPTAAAGWRRPRPRPTVARRPDSPPSPPDQAGGRGSPPPVGGSATVLPRPEPAPERGVGYARR